MPRYTLTQLDDKFTAPDDPAANDTVYGQLGDDTIRGLGGQDVLLGEYGDDRLYGGTGNDTLGGDVGTDYLQGEDGNDELNGGAGWDTLSGGQGDDVYYVDNINDVANEYANAGFDVLVSSVTYSLAGRHIEDFILVGPDHIDATGNGLSNGFWGNPGNNRIDGGAGRDTMDGAQGDDTYIVDNIGDNVIETAGNGFDTLLSSVSYNLRARHIEVMTLTGTANIDATGNSLANRLNGNDGDNRIDGLAGYDTMAGGAGNDTFVVNVVGDLVVEAAGGGNDLVEAAIDWTLADEVERLTLTGTGWIDGTGNASNNLITGNAGDNVLDGKAGNDTLIGGKGNDIYHIDSAGDKVTELHLEGYDVLYTSVTYSLFGRAVEMVLMTGTDDISITGNSLANLVLGNDGDNTINGAGGNDQLLGGLGSDLFLFETGSGADLVDNFIAAENDHIDIHAYTGGVADAGRVTQSGDDVVITLGGGNSILLRDVLRTDVLSQIIW